MIIELRQYNDRLAILHNDRPCLWVAGGQREWDAYVQRKISEGATVIWKD